MPKRQRKRRPAEEPPPSSPAEPPSPAEPRSRRRMLSGVAAVVGASGLLATVTGLVVTRSFDPIADGAADVVGASPLVVYEDAADDLDPRNGTAFAVDHVLPAAVAGPADPDAVSARLVREGAIRVGQTITAMTVGNARRETVVITSIKAKIKQRTTAPTATLVVAAGTGGAGEGPVPLHFDLDGVDLDARTVDKKGRWGGEFLDEHGLTLAAGEKVRFNLIGHARAGLIEWVAQVGYVVNGKARTLDLAPKGRPMRVTGAGATYREAFAWDAEGLTRTPVKKFCPADCRRAIAPATPD